MLSFQYLALVKKIYSYLFWFLGFFWKGVNEFFQLSEHFVVFEKVRDPKICSPNN
jgi:hypothetical protein